MNKFFSGLAVVALLLTPLAIISPAQAATLKVQREYGQGPVTIPAGVDRVEIVFHGRKGNTVRVDEPCGKVSLRGPSGRVARWIDGTWRLPAPGRYSFVLTRCRAHEEDLSPADEDPSPAVARRRRPRGVEVPRDLRGLGHRGRPSARSRAGRPTAAHMESPWFALYLRGAPLLDIANWHQEHERSPQAMYLEAGAPVANELGTMCHERGTARARAGQRSSSCRPTAGSAPAPPGPARSRHDRRRGRGMAAERRYQEVGVRFTSAGDQWVTATASGALAGRC